MLLIPVVKYLELIFLQEFEQSFCILSVCAGKRESEVVPRFEVDVQKTHPFRQTYSKVDS